MDTKLTEDEMVSIDMFVGDLTRESLDLIHKIAPLMEQMISKFPILADTKASTAMLIAREMAFIKTMTHSVGALYGSIIGKLTSSPTLAILLPLIVEDLMRDMLATNGRKLDASLRMDVAVTGRDMRESESLARAAKAARIYIHAITLQLVEQEELKQSANTNRDRPANKIV